MPTIYDVAEIAGVSTKTVSRVLNDDPAVRDQTRDRVLAAMSRLEYRGASLPQPVRSSRKDAPIGVLYTAPASGYQTRFHHAMLIAALEAGNYLAVELADLEQPGYMDNLNKLFSDSPVRSMVLLPPLCDYGPLKELLRERDIRTVLISPITPDPTFPSVSLDDRQAARDITDYLLSLGHTRIAHIAGHTDHSAAFLRRQGYYEAFAARGLPRPPADHVAEGEFSFQSGIAAAEKLLGLSDRPTAIFAANDDMAAAACGVAHRLGLRVPEDVSIVGFDDAPMAAAIWPALTTVQQPYVEMARKAVALLNADSEYSAEPETIARHVIAHALVVRDSAAAID